ncbi:MAG: helix-turn-helix domain-containing protein [Cyanobacteria bacterium]|nr:helix-turn-helix domain-containing protein [Cyanobacteriota bacterium]MDW8200322.1 helix-turn-helix domain-containing protein [Cyanobacteriota bacterium SKYGB_h_bin112]
MTPPKLSDADKQAIVELYRLPEETASTIAHRYGVSPTTVGRILKAGLASEEYEMLAQQKRSPRSVLGAPLSDSPLVDHHEATDDEITEDVAAEASKTALDHTIDAEDEGDNNPLSIDDGAGSDDGSSLESPPRLRRRRSSALAELSDTLAANNDLAAESLIELSSTTDHEFFSPIDEDVDEDELDAEMDADLDSDDIDDDADPLFEEDFDDDDLTDDDDNSGSFMLRQLPDETVQVLPFSEAVLPKTVYLVVDRTSELVTHPLKDFGDLGNIPPSEIQETTLPVFDNHRVARRFSKKNQKVIKVPDGKLLTKASVQLQAKGITRLLIDGHIYAI